MAEWSLEASTVQAGNATRVASTSHTYGIGDMCGAPANDTAQWVDPGTIADVVMRGLPTGHDVYYRVAMARAGWSGVHSFHTGPKNPSQRTRFLAFGDMGVPASMPSAANSRACCWRARPGGSRCI